MARIGLHGLKYATLTDETTETYGTPEVIGKAVSAKFAPETNSAELFADNHLAESDYSFNKGTLTLGVADDDDSIFGKLLGRTIATTGPNVGETIRNVGDAAPYVGVGRVITKMVNGVYKYKAEFLSKVKFKEPGPEDKTRGEAVEFATVEIEGVVQALPNGRWSRSKTFTVKAEAEAYLDTCFGVEEG